MPTTQTKTPPMPPAFLLRLRSADSHASNGWTGPALAAAGMFFDAAKRLYGDDHEVTVKAGEYVIALRRDHCDHSTAEYDLVALHNAYLAVRGALAVVADEAVPR